jgi:hypothetical protein
MIRLRAEIATNCGSIGSTRLEFSTLILQGVLTGYRTHTDSFFRDTGDFFWKYNGLGGI